MRKYGSFAQYDEDLKKIFINDHGELQFDKNDGWALILMPEEPYGYLSDHEYFCIHDDIFYIIKSTHPDKNISLKVISNEPPKNDSVWCNRDIWW